MNRTWTLKILMAMAVVLVLVVAPASMAGDYHYTTTLNCQECHVMHYSQSHGYNADGTGSFVALGSTGPYTSLLRDDVNNLCLACHDGQATIADVLTGNSAIALYPLRQAGFLSRATGAVGDAAAGHTMDVADTLAPGGAWTSDGASKGGFKCIDCHEEHGNINYRNVHLNPDGNDGNITVDHLLSATTTENDAGTKVVYVASDTRTYVQGLINYNEPIGNPDAYANWCKDCHTDFHGAAGDATTIGGTDTGSGVWVDFLRHPVTSAVDIGEGDSQHSSLTAFNGLTNNVKVTTDGNLWDGSASDQSLTCVTCHKAHGNANAFGLIFMSGSGIVTENGDNNDVGTTATDLCQGCHAK